MSGSLTIIWFVVAGGGIGGGDGGTSAAAGAAAAAGGDGDCALLPAIAPGDPQFAFMMKELCLQLCLIALKVSCLLH